MKKIESIIRLIERYLFAATIALIRCVDERQALDQTNGVEIPGGIYGIIDAIKALTGCTEEEAWQRAEAAGIPMGCHIDQKHGAKGCGYAKLVATQPATVLAPEAVPAEDRLHQVNLRHGMVLTLLGEHHPNYAVINYRVGFSIDPDQANADGLGIFNLDVWACTAYAIRLGLDAEKFANHMIEVYKRTVTALTGITEFVILE